MSPLHPVASEWDILGWGYTRHFWGEIPGQEAGTVVRYRVAAGGAGEEVHADDGAYYGYYVVNDPPPAWTQDAVIYQIFADRFFSSASDFPKVEDKPSLKGNGTLGGITAKLDYLAELGINCLWLTPIFSSPSYHGYDATSFFEIDPRLGTKEDFKELIDQAHARGIRILLDFVPNHWSNKHPTFVEAVKDPKSKYGRWYTELINVAFVKERLPLKWEKGVTLFMFFVMMAFSLMSSAFSTILIQTSIKTRTVSPAMLIPMALIYIPIFLGFSFLAFFSLIGLVNTMLHWTVKER